MNRLSERLLSIIPLVVGIALFVHFGWPEKLPQNNLWCALQAKAGNKPRLFGKLREQIVAVRITGLTGKSTVDTLYNLKGRAVISTATRSVEGSVDGDIFTDDAGRLSGLLLWVHSNALGTEALEVTTLNKSGMLDFSRSEAFLHSGANLGASDKLAYPVTMNCHITPHE